MLRQEYPCFSSKKCAPHPPKRHMVRHRPCVRCGPRSGALWHRATDLRSHRIHVNNGSSVRETGSRAVREIACIMSKTFQSVMRHNFIELGTNIITCGDPGGTPCCRDPCFGPNLGHSEEAYGGLALRDTFNEKLSSNISH